MTTTTTTTSTSTTADTSAPLSTLPAELFDCLQVNLGLLADRWHGGGTHLRLGAALRLDPRPGPGGLPTVERSTEQQLAEAQQRLGLVLRELRTESSGAAVRPGPGCYLVADAYHLPWVPYFGRRHLEHSFLAETDPSGAITIVDGYHNETPWGSARPGRWTLDAARFAAALPGPVTVAEFAPDPAGPGAATDASGPGAVEPIGPAAVLTYVGAYAEHSDRAAALEQLTLETWLLARSRKLHAAFAQATGATGATGASTARVAEHLRAWDALTEQVYLAYRRVERGRAEPQGLLARLALLLTSDAEVFGSPVEQPASPSQSDPSDQSAQSAQSVEELRRTVAAVAAAVLGATPEQLLAGQPLSELATFSSFRIVEIVERLEHELGIEFDADDLVPENLHQVDALCAVVQRSPSTGARPAPAAAALPHQGKVR
ncbi:acyl carrier protein [Kitasatospora sp. MAP12-15]|uniref:acyl carrier protein n=1 Tax=unclassified Kitasatospora TaxID=2633591 RepID=UPI0024762102|nr:acyl carrier protein [Kitasatospora sp. MAP12-44]MDH6113893.1 acyl carrier protein [Kitasatospora sp. MAP12-44]